MKTNAATEAKIIYLIYILKVLLHTMGNQEWDNQSKIKLMI